jgi:hypothetical protein
MSRLGSFVGRAAGIVMAVVVVSIVGAVLIDSLQAGIFPFIMVVCVLWMLYEYYWGSG